MSHTANLVEVLMLSYYRKKFRGIQMKPNELSLIVRSLKEFDRPNFLIFGFGFDTGFWLKQNKKGRTCFLEDNSEWFMKVKLKFPDVDAYLLEYPNNITQWRELLRSPEQLHVELPEAITERKWDVILVDGPAGYEIAEKFPGRMSSIYMASKLVAPGGYVLVHDCDREVEAVYADAFLGGDKLCNRAMGRSELRQYRNMETA